MTVTNHLLVAPEDPLSLQFLEYRTKSKAEFVHSDFSSVAPDFQVSDQEYFSKHTFESLMLQASEANCPYYVVSATQWKSPTGEQGFSVYDAQYYYVYCLKKIKESVAANKSVPQMIKEFRDPATKNSVQAIVDFAVPLFKVVPNPDPKAKIKHKVVKIDVNGIDKTSFSPFLSHPLLAADTTLRSNAFEACNYHLRLEGIEPTKYRAELQVLVGNYIKSKIPKQLSSKSSTTDTEVEQKEKEAEKESSDSKDSKSDKAYLVKDLFEQSQTWNAAFLVGMQSLESETEKELAKP